MVAQQVEDGTFLFDGGQDAYRTPDRIPDNSYARGVNVTTRKGVLGPRPPFINLDLRFTEETITSSFGYTRKIKDIFETGKYQCSLPYIFGADSFIVIVISGYIFFINKKTLEARLASSTIRVNEYRSRINGTNAGRYIVLHDPPDYPVIIEGNEVFRANPNNIIAGNRQPQVPVSTISTFNNNRLFVANAGVEFTAGDPVGNLATPEAPITFTEVLEPAQAFTGQTFSLGTQNDGQTITAMGFIQQNDKSTGIGPLFVATKDSVYYYRADLPRTDWESVDFGSVLLFNAGIAGPRAVTNVNSDLIFLSGEGYLHALSTSRNDSERWGNVPISREVENYLKFQEEELKEFAFIGYYGNRVYIGANPYRVNALDTNERLTTDYVHGGMVVLSMDNLSSLRGKAPPAWEGLWTGVAAMDFVNVDTQGYVIGKTGGINGVYMIDETMTVDIVQGVKRPIQSYVYTREYQFKSPLLDKTVNAMMFPLHDLKGKVDVQVEYRPSHSKNFAKFGSFEHCAPYKQCTLPLAQLTGRTYHNIKELIFGSPNDMLDCDPVTEDLYTISKGFQFRIGIRADNWQLRAIGVEGTIEPDPARDNTCDRFNAVGLPVQCTPDWNVPELSLCEDCYDDN